MPKYLFAFLIVLSCNFCFGQGGKFQLYLTKSCSTVEQLDSSYYLLPMGHLDTSYLPKNGTVYLPAKGKYIIGFVSGPVLDSDVVEIKDTGLVILRLKEPKIQRFSSGAIDMPPVYTQCNSVINGYAEEFYPNGNPKLRGDFTRGYPKDSLVTFYPTGKVQKRLIILPKIVNIEEYNASGNLISLRHDQNKSFMTYSDTEWIEFYPDGKMKSDQSVLKHVTRIREFYPTGQLKVQQDKHKRIEYYDNGNKSTTYYWHSKKDDARGNLNFTVKQIKYDRNGQVQQTAVFEDWDYYGSPPKLDILKSDWVDSFRSYKDGKETLVVEDMDTKEFVKKHAEVVGEK